jgi:hypothetical protein
MSTIKPTEIAGRYIVRAANAADVATLDVLRRASLDSIHALYASGLLSATENAEALNRLVDTCHDRYTELTAVAARFEVEVA